jgi:hypothetical protein
MPVSLNAIAADTATAALPLTGGTLNIEYYPNKITEKLIGEMKTNSVTAGQLLSGIIKSWDLYQDDAQTVLVPLDADSISGLGIPTIEAIITAITSSISPNTVAPQTLN